MDVLKMTIYSGFSHWKWWFSIVMLVYQRVKWMQNGCFPGWTSSPFRPIPRDSSHAVGQRSVHKAIAAAIAALGVHRTVHEVGRRHFWVLGVWEYTMITDIIYGKGIMDNIGNNVEYHWNMVYIYIHSLGVSLDQYHIQWYHIMGIAYMTSYGKQWKH